MAPASTPAPTVAWADEEALGHILENLIDNAVKYTPPGGVIQVRSWAENGEACLDVADNGIGIAERDLQRIFERFYRVDKARSRALGGTGCEAIPIRECEGRGAAKPAPEWHCQAARPPRGDAAVGGRAATGPERR